MKRFFPKSIAGQIIVVVLVGLTVSHIFSMAIYTADRAHLMTLSGGHQIAHQISAITRLIEKTPISWRAQILEATKSRTLDINITPDQQLSDQASVGFVNNLMRSYLANLIGIGSANRIVVQIMIVPDLPPRQIQLLNERQRKMHVNMVRLVLDQANRKIFHASIKLVDGSWLNFSSAVPEEAPIWSMKTILSMALMVIGVILASVWVIRKMTRPLRVFTAASKRLGKDVTAPPLIVSGPVELQEATDAFNEMQYRLRQMVENRTQMLAAISHDLRTPITLLRLRSESMQNAEEKEKMLSTLSDMEEMISSTLSFAREDAIKEEAERVDLTALLGSICDDLVDVGKHVRYEPTEKIVLECRPMSLKRAFLNLIENGLKHGTEVYVSMEKKHNFVEIFIDDNGPGIPESEFHKVFTPFYRVDMARGTKSGGIGLGLSVVRSVVDKHGGDIVLSNQASTGLRVAIHLPF